MTEELKVIISAEVAKFKKGVDDAKGAMSTFKSEMSKHKEELTQAWTSIGEGATKASKTIITGTVAITTALASTAVATKDYRAEQAKLTSAFETAGASAETAKGVYKGLYRVLGEEDTAVEAAGHLAQLTTNQSHLSEWTNICQGVYATFGDSLPIEGLTEAANETAKTKQVTGSLADALNWAGVSEDQFNAKLEACNNEAQREALIRETLTGIYGEAAAAYEKNAADVLAQNEAQMTLQESLAELGATMQPLITAFTQFASQALAVIIPYIQQIAEQYGPQLKEVLQNIGNMLAPIAAFVANNLPMIATIAGIILGIAAAYNTIKGALAAYNAIKTIYTAVTTIATAASTAFAAANAAAVGPILLVVAAIAAVIAIIVLLVKNWDKIVAAFKDGCEKLKSWAGDMKDKVVNKFNELKDGAVNKFNELKTAAANKFNEMKTAVSNKVNEAKTAAVNKFNEMKSGVVNKVSEMRQGIADGLNNIKSSMVNGFTTAKNNVLNIFGNIKSGIANALNGARDAVRNAIDKIKSFFNFKWELPKIKLPHFRIEGKFSLNPPSIPSFKVDWYKLGGVFDKPTLFGYGGGIGGLGEAGAEAVVPLENNLGWLDKLADMLSDRMGGNTPIVLKVGEKVFAETAVSSINNLTKQTGELQLVLG